MKTLDPDLGQHILVDKEIIDLEIKEADLSKKDRVIEIGAGKGVLTKELIKNSSEVLAFEIDDKFQDELDKIKKGNLKIIIDNALKYNWNGYNKIVSNIPYHLSEKIILKAIKSEIPKMVLIVGETFKNKLLSEDKIGLIASIYYDIMSLKKISPSSFEPPPRTNSWLVKLSKRKISKEEEMILDVSFSKGKIKNALIKQLIKKGKTKREAKKLVNEFGFTEQVLNKPASKITAKLFIKIKEELARINL